MLEIIGLMNLFTIDFEHQRGVSTLREEAKEV